MKKISLKSLNLKEVEQLTREQLKNVIGGYTGGTGDVTDDGGTASGSRWVMCCPESIAQGVGCSRCVEVGPGQSATCDMGYLVEC